MTRNSCFAAVLVVAMTASLLAPKPVGAQVGGQADRPTLVVALGSSLSDVGTAASLVAAGKGEAVVFAESVERLGGANSTLVREQMPEQVYIVGGSRAVGAGVEEQLRSLVPGVSIQRFAGSTRVETAALAADEALAGRSVSKIIVANGWSLPDVGAAAAAVAAGAADAVLYAERGDLGLPTREALGAHRPGTVLIAGGTAALSAGVEADAATAAGGAATTRLGGATRLETAALIAQEALPGGAETVVVADGWSLSDVGVAASLSASLTGSAVLYSADGDDLPAALDSALRSLAPDRIILVDGSGAASRGILNGLARRGIVTRIASAVDATRAGLGEDVGEPVEVIEETNLAAAIADAEAYMVELVNELRESVGVPPLHQNALVGDVARNWSDSMQERNVHEHNPNFASQYPPGSVLSGENIATVPCLDCPEGLRKATRRAFDALVDSPGHYRSMVHPGFGQIGVGIALPAGGGPRVIRVTQNFACYATQPLQSNETCPAGPGPVRSGTEIPGGDISVVVGIEVPYAVSSLRDGKYVAMDYSGDGGRGTGGLCAIRSDKSITCWSGSSESLQREAPSGAFKDIAVGGHAACALRLSGAIECWGATAFPELLDPPSGAYEALANGGLHGCALRIDRTVDCWGAAVRGGGPNGPWVDESHLRPPSGTYTAVSAGGQHSCALSTDRSIRCWGRNSAGQTDAPAGEFIAVSAGNSDSCAVRTDSTVHCWGSNLNGQMRFSFGGNGSQSIERIAVGNDSVCVLDSNSDLACRHTKRASVAYNVIIPPDGSSFDVSVPDGPFASIGVGSRSGCGLRPDGSIACWGQGVDNLHAPPGAYQALSNGCGLRQDGTIVCWKGFVAPDLPPTGFGYPERGGVVAFPGTYTAMGSGPSTGHSGDSYVCGVSTDTAINCFGLDLVTGRAWPQGHRIEGSFRSVVVGPGAACALRTNATISCWGEESARQFGMLDAPSGSFTQISAGFLHFCAIRSNQTVTCWGDNGAGQLDAPGGSFTSISSAGNRTCGIRPDGSAACWGDWHGSAPEAEGGFASIVMTHDGGCYVGEYYDDQYGTRQHDFGCFGEASWRLPWLPRDDQGMFTEWAHLDPYSRCGIRTDGGVTCWPELPDGVSWHTAETMVWTYGTDVEASGQWPW